MSQEPELTKDSLAIISFADKLEFKANISTQADNFFYTSASGDRLDIRANNNLRLFLSLDYEFIGASIGFAPGFLNGNQDELEKGTSSFSDYRFRFFLGQWVQGLQYQNNKGYYVKNTGDFLPGWQEGTDPYIQFPGLKRVVYGMSTTYVFNPEFSLRNLLYQTEWQRKSAGSFVPGIQYNYTLFSLKETAANTREHQWNIRFSPAYYYTFVWQQHWFISGNIAPSLGLQYAQTRTTNNAVFSRARETLFIQSLEGGLQLGYSSPGIIAGFIGNFSAFWQKDQDRAALENDQLYANLYFGYRFDAPGFMEKTMKWLIGN